MTDLLKELHKLCWNNRATYRVSIKLYDRRSVYLYAWPTNCRSRWPTLHAKYFPELLPTEERKDEQ